MLHALTTATAFLLSATQAWAHGSHIHAESAEKRRTLGSEDVLQAVNASYIKQVKAIFQRS